MELNCCLHNFASWSSVAQILEWQLNSIQLGHENTTMKEFYNDPILPRLPAHTLHAVQWISADIWLYIFIIGIRLRDSLKELLVPIQTEPFFGLTGRFHSLSQDDRQTREKRSSRLVTCSPFPLWPSLAGLLWLGLLHLLPSFLLIVAPSIFILFLSEVIVFIVTTKVICRERVSGVQCQANLFFRRPLSFSSRSNSLLWRRKPPSLPAESFLDLESFSSDSSLQRDQGNSLLNWSESYI